MRRRSFSLCMFFSLCVCVCVCSSFIFCVCVCVWTKRREEEKKMAIKSNKLNLFHEKPSIWWEQIYFTYILHSEEFSGVWGCSFLIIPCCCLSSWTPTRSKKLTEVYIAFLVLQQISPAFIRPTPPIGLAWEGGGEFGLKLNCMLGNSFYINWQKKKKRFHPRFRYSHDRSHSLNKFSKSALSNSQLCLFEIQGTWHIKLHHIRFDKLDKVSPKLVAVCFSPLGCWFALLISIGFPVMVMVLLLLLSLLGRNRSLNKLVNELKRI